jgi:predicted phage tail protein
MFKEITGGLFMAIVFFVAGDWFLKTNEAAGLVVFLMGIVSLVFLVATMISVPSSGGRTSPTPD